MLRISHVARIIHAKIRDFTKARSPGWRTVEKAHLRVEPRCAACGSVRGLQVHHVKPFALFPEQELEPENLITLCESLGGGEHHLMLGHGSRWKSYNPHIRSDAAEFLIHPDRRQAILARARERSLPIC